MKSYKPTNGWSHLAGSVWEHTNKTRIHTMGVIRFPNMTFVYANKYPESVKVHKMISINGGNRKRGLMALAINMSSSDQALLSSD